MDRIDLSLEMRIKIGDWPRVIKLIRLQGGGNDQFLEKAWNGIGDYYYDRQQFALATSYYSQGRNNSKLVELWYILEEFGQLEKLSNMLNENDVLLNDIAEKFVSVGMCRQAVNVYLKIGDITSAINTCVYLNQWNVAIDLAETHKFKDIQTVLNNYASHILSQNRKKEVIELYRRANFCVKGARVLYDLAKEAIKTNQKPLTIKKLFVLGALEIERHHSLQKLNGTSVIFVKKAVSALENMMEDDSAKSTYDTIDNMWRGAEAFHYLMLAQRQLYAGIPDAAVITCLHLRSYQDIIPPKQIFSLLALAAIHSQYYYSCARALAQLQIVDQSTEYYSNLAFEIFSQY